MALGKRVENLIESRGFSAEIVEGGLSVIADISLGGAMLVSMRYVPVNGSGKPVPGFAIHNDYAASVADADALSRALAVAVEAAKMVAAANGFNLAGETL